MNNTGSPISPPSKRRRSSRRNHSGTSGSEHRLRSPSLPQRDFQFLGGDGPPEQDNVESVPVVPQFQQVVNAEESGNQVPTVPQQQQSQPRLQIISFCSNHASAPLVYVRHSVDEEQRQQALQLVQPGQFELIPPLPSVGTEAISSSSSEVHVNFRRAGDLEQTSSQGVLSRESSSETRAGEMQLVPIPMSSAQSRVDDSGWQESRLLLTQRAAYLLNNPRMSDVRFLVGEGKVEIFGHKTILAMGSPVFEAQFFGHVGSDNENIELPDLEPETFLLFLKYLYTDTLDEPIDEMKVLQVLRPAKKYIVPHLIEKCSDILMSELKAENVFQVYNYAVFFDLQKLEGACLRYIDRECEAIVQTEEFTMLNSQTLADFLKRDGLNIREDVLFKAVLRWAELECERNSVDINDQNIRQALGDNIRLIRFPTMTAEEFANDVASRNILTAEESRSIFIYMCSGSTRLSSTMAPEFPTKKRGFFPQQYLVSRFSGEPIAHSLNYRSGEIYTYRINFKADRQIFFRGVNIFSIKCGASAQYVEQRRFNGAVYLYESDSAGDRDLNREKARKQFSRENSLESELETTSGSRYFPVLFDHEIRIPANQMFTVCAVVSVASSSYHQQSLNTYMGVDEVTDVAVRCAEDLIVNFTFSNCYGEASVGRYTQSQIPEVVFSL